MKKLLIAGIAAIAISSCGKTNESKMRDLIESQLETTMKDYSSYEFVEMSPITEAIEPYSATKEYDMLYNLKNDIEHKRLEYSAKSINEELLPKLEQQIDSIDKLIARNKAEYKGESVGYKTKFSFRGKNSLGATILTKKVYISDKEFNKILHVIDLE